MQRRLGATAAGSTEASEAQSSTVTNRRVLSAAPRPPPKKKSWFAEEKEECQKSHPAQPLLWKGQANPRLGKVACVCPGPRRRQEDRGVVNLFFYVATTYLSVLACVMSLQSPRRLGESSGSSIRGAGPGCGFFTRSHEHWASV